MSREFMLTFMRFAIMFWLLVADALFMYGYRRRRHFILRVLGSVAVSLGVSVLIGWTTYQIMWQMYQAGTYSEFIYPIINLIVHYILFGLNIAVTFLCFDERPGIILFGNVAAYAMQNIGTLMTNICGLVWPATKFISEAPVTLLNFSVWFGCYAVTYIIVYLIFAKSIRETVEISAANSRTTIALFLAIVIVAVSIRSLNSGYANENPVPFILMSICDIVCCFTVLLAQFLIGRSAAQKRKNDAILHMNELKLKQYEFTKENIDIINLKCHDLKHQLLELKNHKQIDGGYIAKLTESISFYDSVVQTGCEALDTVLTDKNMYCSKNQIQLSVIADGEKLGFMDVPDVYSLFGNALDNAIEYVMTLQPEKRVIKLSVTAVGNLLSVSVRNYYEGEPPRFVNGLPQTTKGDNGYHGFGVKSIRKIVERYGGSLSVMVRDNQFIVSALLPQKGKKD